MIYLDDIAALQFWRAQERPELIRERCSTTSRLHGCPGTVKQLRRELAELPDWLPRHFMVGDPGKRLLKEECSFTCATGALPRGSFYVLPEAFCVASPELVFLQAARSLTRTQLIALGFELCGTYSHAKNPDGESIERKTPLTSIEAISDFLSRSSGLQGVKRAESALHYVIEDSASPMESEIAMLMSMPRRYGGFGLPRPIMNYCIAFDEEACKMASTSFARADLCWPEAKLDIEYDSELWHSSRQQSSQDKSRANALNSMHYMVIFVSNGDYNDSEAFESIVNTAADRIGFYMRKPNSRETQLREELRREVRETRSNPMLLNFTIGRP